MKLLTLITTLFTLWLLCSCNSGTLKDLPFKADLNDTIRINYNSMVGITSENLAIQFKKIRESRCPANAKCIQPGEANVSLLVTKANQSEPLVLTAKGLCYSDDGSCGQEKNVLNYNIKLVNVYPYPGKEPGDPNYYAKIVVSRKGRSGDVR